MILLTVRSDNPDAEVGVYKDTVQLAYKKWSADRQLAETLHQSIADVLIESSQTLESIEGVVAYEGPGSFTGLRIGLSVVNALGVSLHVPLAATTGDDWILTGIAQLLAGKGVGTVLPEYGAPVHITAPKA